MDKDAEKSDFPLLALSPTSLPVMGGSGNRDWNIALDTTQTLQSRTENNIKSALQDKISDECSNTWLLMLNHGSKGSDFPQKWSESNYTEF